MNLDRRLFLLVRQYPAPFVLSVVFGALGGFLLVGQAFLLSGIVDAVFMLQKGRVDIVGMLFLFAAAGLFRTLFNWTGQIMAEKGTLRIKQSLHEKIFRKISDLGPLHAVSTKSGSLSTTILKGVEALDPYFSQYIPQLALGVLLPLFVLAVVFPTDMLTGFILLATAPLIPLFMILIGKAAQKATEKQWRTLARMSGNFLDVLQGLTTLKLFGRSKDRVRSISDTSEAFRHSTMKVLKIAFLSSLALELVGAIGTAIVAVEIGLRLMAGSIAFRPAFFLLLLTPDFYLPLRQLGAKFHAGMEGTSAANDIFGLLEKERFPAAPVSNPAPLENAAAQPISFDSVTFSYPGGDGSDALRNVTCRIEPGSVTAITGPSGAGKTTFINMLLRFIDPHEGSIMFGERNLSAIDRGEWWKLISWIPQHPYLFNTTLRENLLLANENASEQELMEAVEKSRLGALVRSLARGLDTPVGESGASISGGEAQRLSFARAFLKNAPILVLDEPTSHTDPILERELVDMMQTLMQGKTAILIAHRLSTVQRADRILVFDKGRIAQSGTHESLLKSDGFYRSALQSFAEEPAT